MKFPMIPEPTTFLVVLSPKVTLPPILNKSCYSELHYGPPRIPRDEAGAEWMKILAKTSDELFGVANSHHSLRFHYEPYQGGGLFFPRSSWRLARTWPPDHRRGFVEPPLVRCQQVRLAHPNGPIATNKAAALAKFLERKLHQSGGLNSIDPKLLELAVKNAKETVNASNVGASSSGRVVRHVSSFGDTSEEVCEDLHDKNIEEDKKLKKTKHRVSINSNREAKVLKKKKTCKKSKRKKKFKT
ncbi:hypothetical protein KFK09_000410 [Dendrobium nobile]|uniref:Uncharacterized protein n=1 Tax=Dendrobium nobile TaxID=94219 RepID=A0A8T3CBT0_DENNO|nr:hypothetical protein KFK09_000410 [Dendrobium nobile]